MNRKDKPGVALTRVAMTSVGLLAGLFAVGCGDDSPSTPTDAGRADVVVEAAVPVTDAGEGGAPEDSGLLLPQGQIDRVGRPCVKLALIQPRNRQAYNAFDTFAEVTKYPLRVETDLQGGLVLADRWDGVDNWSGGDVPFDGGLPPDAATPGTFLKHPAGSLVQLDALLLDTSLPYAPAGFLDLEAEALAIATHTTSGGRALGDDACDRMLSLLTKKALTGVSDGVSAPTKPPSDTFPYLAAPN